MKMRERSVFFIGFLSGRDNRSGDIGRLIWLLFSIAYIGLTACHMASFDPVTWCGGAGALLAAGGGSLALKRHTEPEGSSTGDSR